jgi:ABC-2 type transport system ATP-binding protein
MSKTLVAAKKLVKVYDSVRVVNGVSFSINSGEVFGILGPNGAGKTTTLEMIEGLRDIDGGEALINGVNVAKEPSKARYLIGVQPQTPAFQDKTKAKEVLELFGATYGVKVSADELLEKVRLSEKANTYTENLSGGQLQRLSIAAALVHSPKVLFMDEPTTGLDPQARRNIWDLVKDIKKQGITVVLTTHYMEEAEVLCDRVAIMDNGKIIAQDTPANLISDLLQRGFKKKRTISQATLEDVFIDLTGKDLRE